MIGMVELLTPERLDAEAESSETAPRLSRDEAVARMRARVYPALERWIAEEPGQWISVLSTIWDKPAEPNAAHP
jgi:hypothetical protein